MKIHSLRIGLIFLLILFWSICAQESNPVPASLESIQTIDISGNADSWLFTENKIIAVTEDRIIFEPGDAEEKTFELPENHLKTLFSKNREYFAVLSLNPLKSVKKIDREMTIAVYDASMQILYQLQMTQFYDHSLPSVNISGLDGSLVLGRNDTGEISFYSGRGELLRNITLFPESDYDLERTLVVDISLDGSMVAAVAGKRGSSPADSDAPEPDAEPVLFSFLPSGEEQWRKPLPEMAASRVAISPDARFIAVGCYTITLDGQLTKRTVIFDDEGSQRGQTDMLFKIAQFSRDSQQLLLAGNQEARMITLPDGSPVWKTSVSRREGMITAVDMSPDGSLAAILTAHNDWNGSSFIFRDPVIRIVDSNGKLAGKKEFHGEIFQKPAMMYSSIRNVIFTGFEQNVQVLKVR